jgi:hypothetical protein
MQENTASRFRNHMDMPVSSPNRALPHSSHWGAFAVVVRDGGVEVMPHPRDPDPSPLLGNIPASVSHRARIGASADANFPPGCSAPCVGDAQRRA